jgi:hypothetical protein
MHVLMGIIVLTLALVLITTAVILTPKLSRIGIKKMAGCAFGASMISIAAYLAYVSSLFFRDELGGINYSPELFVIRIVALLSAIWFLGAVLRCDL